MKKRIVIILAVVLGLLVCCAVAAEEPASGKWGENLSWTLDDDWVLTISGSGEMAESNSSERYVSDYQKVKKVIIKSGVTNIGEQAFEYWRALQEVSIPDTVTKIEWLAFYNCSSLKKITIPDSVTIMGSYAFEGCTSLTEAKLSGGMAAIPTEAFNSCSSLKTITIPKSIKEIGVRAFNNCSALETVNYDGSANEWAGITFNEGNLYLKKAKGENTLGSGSCGDNIQWRITSDGLLSLTGKGKMKDYDSTLYAAGSPWNAETLITSVEISSGITYIGNCALSGLRLKKELSIPATVTELGATAFKNFSGTLVFEGDAPAFADGVLTDAYAIIRYPKGNSTWEQVAGKKYGATWIAWAGTENSSEDKKRDETEATKGEISANENRNDYSITANTISSYLTEGEDGTLYRIEHTGEKIIIEQYNKDKKVIWKKTLKMELPVWGGFYSGENYNFIVVGQSNWEENDSTEIMRVIRYSKNWNRIDAAGIFGANTVEPFHAGSLQMAQTGDFLFIHTCHQMYQSADGKNHQANMNYKLYIPTMSFIDSESSIRNDAYDYVSHSFNQFVIIDGADVIKVDHGDAYPRSVTMLKRRGTAERITEEGSDRITILAISGETGDNYTGVTVGGADVSSTHYLVAGTSIDQAKFRKTERDNLFIATVPRNSFNDSSVVFRWITTYPESDNRNLSTPQLVKISGKQFLLMWTETEDGNYNAKERTLKYALLDSTGAVTSEIYSVSGLLSDCKPIVRGKQITWYVTRDTDTVFYTIDLDNPKDLRIETYSNWINKDGNRLYYGEDGKKASGFRKINKTAMVYDSEKQEWVNRTDLCTYYFDADGKMLTGDQIIEGKRYHFEDDGVMTTGFYELDDEKYYLTEDGQLTGIQKLEVEESKFNYDKNEWEKVKVQHTYYFDADGKMQMGDQIIEGKRYFFSMVDGTIVTGFYTLDDATYYLTENGPLTGLQQIEETEQNYNWDTDMYETETLTNTYYFDENGVMQTGQQTVDGEMLLFNSRGRKVAFTAPEPIIGLTYNGSTQGLITAGSVEGDSFVYAFGEDKNTAPDPGRFRSDIPTAVDAGTYYVWYKVYGINTKPEVIEVSIEDKVQGFVARCYRLILNREPDAGGLQGWCEALKSKTAAAAQIIDGFVRSEEFVGRNLSAGDSVDILYKTMLNRAADESGKAGWVDALNQGYSLQNIIDGFCGSDEFTTLCREYEIEPGKIDAPAPTPRGKIEGFVKRCYSLILSREADAGGLQGWSDALEQRVAAAAQIIDGFVRSPEYLGRNLSAGESVDILYQTMLGRAADEGGKAGWVDALGQGYTLQHIINGFCGSAEFTAICDGYGIVAGSVAVNGAMVKREGVAPEGDEAEAPVVFQGYASEFINEEKIRAFVEHCYKAVFGREGDAEGVENYTALILNGKKTPKKVAYEFVFSPEFQNKLPGNEEFIRILYRLYFDREPGAEEIAGWVQMLEDGATLEEIVNGFTGSDEFKAIVNAMKE